MMKSNRELIKTTFLFMAFLLFPFFASASTTDGTIDSTDKYAWGENIGWINFGASEGNVHITDSALTGYAWGENIGWISLNCSNGDSCSAVDYKVANDGAGNLSGYAWSENAGWINFSPTYGGVTINSSGEFLGYAWGENIGWIVFNCATTSSCGTVDYKVKTDWRSQSARPACNNSSDDDGDGKTDYPNDPGCDSLTDDNETDPGGGGLPPDAYNPPNPPPPAPENPEGKFSVIINNGDKYTNSQTVKLKLNTGSNTQRMSISNSSSFENASQVSYQENIEWKLSSCHCEPQRSNLKTTSEESNGGIASSLCGAPRNDSVCTVYVKFYTAYGVSSETVSDDIIFDAIPPEIRVNYVDSFFPTEDIIINGFTEPDAKVGIKLDNNFTDMPPTFADSTGYFSFNLGRLSVGLHILDLKGTDLAGNVGETFSLNLIVKKREAVISTEPKPKPAPSPALPKAPSPAPSAPLSPTPPASAQPPEQPSIPPSSEPQIEEPKTPPSFSEPSAPPEPTEPIQTRSAETITSEPLKQSSSAGGFWQSVKMAFENIFGAIVDNFNNAGKKIANLFNHGQNSFAVFVKDIKILGGEIKIAVFESSNPLQISDVKVISISSTSVEVIWQTNHKATSKVNYGLSRIYDKEKQDSKKVKNHSIILTNLSPDTIYHYEVISQNGSYTYDADRIFITARE